MATQIGANSHAPSATTSLTAEEAARVLDIGAAAVRKRGRAGTLASRLGPDGVLRYAVETALVEAYHTANPPVAATADTPRTLPPAAPFSSTAPSPPHPSDEADQQRAIQVQIDRRMQEVVDAVAADRRTITAQIDAQMRQQYARQLHQLT